jgi:muskelin
MLYDPVSRLLYIFAGQRLKDYLSDFYAYSLDRDEVIEISRDYSRQAGPDAGFTQRATMDAETQEIYILSGYMKVKGHDAVKNSFWVYDIRTNIWKKVYQNEAINDDNQRTVNETEPCPRYAHQLVYDNINKVQYLFGGNPGDKKDITKRLDDFWELRLHR